MTLPKVGAVGFAVSTGDGTSIGAPTVYFNNDVGGTSALPAGRYRVQVDRSWDDYETGVRVVGTLLDEADIETAIKTGTTGHATTTDPYRPTKAYFAGPMFEETA